MDGWTRARCCTRKSRWEVNPNHGTHLTASPCSWKKRLSAFHLGSPRLSYLMVVIRIPIGVVGCRRWTKGTEHATCIYIYMLGSGRQHVPHERMVAIAADIAVVVLWSWTTERWCGCVFRAGLTATRDPGTRMSGWMWMRMTLCAPVLFQDN